MSSEIKEGVTRTPAEEFAHFFRVCWYYSLDHQPWSIRADQDLFYKTNWAASSPAIPDSFSSCDQALKMLLAI